MFIDEEKHIRISSKSSKDCKKEEIEMFVLALAQLHNNFIMEDKSFFDTPICRALRSSASLIEGKTSNLTNDEIEEAESVCKLLSIFKGLYDHSIKIEKKEDHTSSSRSRLYDSTFCDVLSRCRAIRQMRTE